MSSFSTEDIVFRELAAFACAFGVQVEVGQLQQRARRITAQIALGGESTKEEVRLLNRRQCAALLGVSMPTLDRYIRQEGLPFRVKNPRANRRIHYVFVERDVLKWASSHLSGFRKRRSPK